MIGAILDIYFEGEPSFRACVFDVASNGGLWVINLKTGEKRLANEYEYEPPVIKDIFAVEGDV